MFIRDKVQFQDLRSGRIFLDQATKLYNLKSQSSEVKHDSALTSNVEFATFHIETEPCLTETKCNFRTFGVNESFWAKQQSCITLKVSLWKWCPFFDFVCFSGCHFTQPGFSVGWQGAMKNSLMWAYSALVHGIKTLFKTAGGIR